MAEIKADAPEFLENINLNYQISGYENKEFTLDRDDY